tara:strand:- start:143 stop:604 length:462 start_codon:yes stop_codon:yes gene_type:complete
MHSFKVGDILYRSKLLVQHVGVVVGDNAVLHNLPSGIEICSLAKYGEGKDIKVISSKLSGLDKMEFIKKGLESVKEGKKYQLFNFNCEHLVSSVNGSKPTSSQVTGAAMGSIIAGIYSLSQGGDKVITAMGLGAIAGLIIINCSRKYDYKIQS